MFTCALVWKYWHSANSVASNPAAALPISSDSVWQDGKRVGFTLAEAGPYGGSKFRSARRRAIENLREYESLSYTPLGEFEELSRQLLRPLADRRAGADTITSAQLPAEQWQVALARRLAADLLVLNGMNLNAYLQRVGKPECQWPFNQDAFLELLQEYDISHPPPEAEDRSSLFETATQYWQYRSTGGAQNMVGSACLTGRGFVYAVGHATAAEPTPPLLDPLLSAQDRASLFGSLAQAGYVCFEPVETREATLRAGGRIPVAKVVVVCTTRDESDRYPVVFYYWFDKAGNRWWLRWMTRQSSILMAQTVPPLF
jgi:hypothetical protein